MPIYIIIPKIFKHFAGCALWPFVLFKDPKLKQDPVFINHERIHLRQQQELLLVFFYIWYSIEFVIHLIRLQSQYAAYRAISFEKEAYAKENDLSYLKQRPFWSFLRYL